MAFKLIETPQDRWRAATRPISWPWSAPGATFVNDQLVERPALDAQGDVLSWESSLKSLPRCETGVASTLLVD